MTSDDRREPPHCYRVRLPSAAEAFRIRGLTPPVERTIQGIRYEAASEEPGPVAILCGKLGPPYFHCGGVSEALCDFPLGDENRTCDRALCLTCAPTVDADKNYCHEHDEHGRKMLLFPQPQRVVLTEPAPAPKRAKPLPKRPPESHRWRVRQGRGDAASHGAVLTGWKTELEARRFAIRVGGYVETWDQFVALWRALYPLKPRGEEMKKPRPVTAMSIGERARIIELGRATEDTSITVPPGLFAPKHIYAACVHEDRCLICGFPESNDLHDIDGKK